MTVVELPRTFVSTEVDGALTSRWESDAECTVAIAGPSDDDALRREYLDGAQRSYRRNGVGAAIDVEAIRSTPHPDERFRTKMMWWDRRTVASHAAPNQTAKIIADMGDIRLRPYGTSRFGHASVRN